MKSDRVSGRHNFTTVRDAGYFKQQVEEMHATNCCPPGATSACR
jgi:NAD(P)H dehydrogenase (quinone)